MVDFLYSIDVSILFFFNHTLSNPAFDKFFSTITNVNSWFITYILMVGILLIKGGKKGRLALTTVLIMVTVSDQVGYKILKEFFKRPRPFSVLTNVLLPAGEAGAYSFPSNHAINNFAVAVFFSILYPQYKYPLFVTATLIAISRVYLGVHYPSDVLGGAIIGTGFGYAFAWLYKQAAQKLKIS